MQIHFSKGTRPCAGGRDVGDQANGQPGNYSARKVCATRASILRCSRIATEKTSR